MSTIPQLDFRLLQGSDAERRAAIDTLGQALADTGFVAVSHHGLSDDAIATAYDAAKRFFALPQAVKQRYVLNNAGQRGFTSFGQEHAKDAKSPDLKEFWQVGRTDVPSTHLVHAKYGANVWPNDEVPAFAAAMTHLYESLDRIGRTLLAAGAAYLSDDAAWYRDAVDGGDTILRVIHYPPIAADAPAEAIRAGAHEDINLITLLIGATEPGLELLQKDGTWLPIQAAHGEIVVDAGDMLQNCTNGIYKSTTHRVVRPANERSDVPRFSMPCFIHPRGEVDLTPRAACVARSGGTAKYPSISAGEYLAKRLAEIGLVTR